MDKLEPEVGLWLKNTAKNADEIARLETMASDLISTFTRDLLKERKVIAEILCLVSVLSKADFRNLFHMYFSNIEKSVLLDIHTFKGIGLLLQSASVDHLDTEDLMKILRMISTRVQNFQYLSQAALFHLVVAISSILDAMTDIKVTGLKRVELHGPLLEFLDDLQAGDDPYLEYYASYAIQALLCVPDNESPWQPTVRRTTKIVKGISGSISAVRGLDLKRFMTRLQSIQEGLEGFHELHDLTKTSPDSVMTESERGIVASLANRKQAWYAALRGADTLIQGGELAKFRILVCGASCRREIGFQLGICQRLGNLAANPLWSTEIRQNALRFLEEIYRDDLTWDQNPKVKVYILNVLDELSVTVKDLPEASLLLKDFAEDGDVSKQEIYRSFTKKGSKAGQYLLNSSTPEFAVPSLLDLLQREGDVRADLRRMAQRRIEERDGTIYVPPLAKSHLHASDDEVFPLCPVINEFLSSDQKVLLLLGDSGAGKTMFNHELDLRLWKSYLEDPNGSLIPLFINLFTIPGPEQDLIAKHLRICNFSKAQIQELRYRVFVLICDGYDESQLSQNLYDANGFNKEGGWRVKMVISCRSENLRRDYLDLFRPVRLSPTDPDLFRQAVLAPFSMNQVKDFIDQHVAIKEPLFVSADYQSIINQIPSLQGLVTSPFLLALSLEVLPRFADPGQKVDLSKITRVRLFDEFMVQWLERTKKRLEFTEMSGPEMEVFERLSDDGFIQKGLLYLRDLSAAIYKEQKGNSVVNYVKARDNKTWKERFFGQQDKKSQLLRMAMPMTRTGNQYGFIHRSFLEYGVSRAIYDPDMWVGMGLEPENEISVTRRKSVDSAFSFEMELEMEVTSHGPDPESLLVKMSFIKDTSVLQFLVERVNSEPVFKNQLLAYIKASKIDKKWRIAAANAMTILVRAGFRFSHHDLRGIQVPGADMSFGVFDSAQLQGADLRKTNLQKTWFRQADLSQARMHGVQLGELPNLDEAKMSQAFAYAPDGKRFYAGTADGRIIAYNTSTWNAIEALEGHNRRVTNVIFSSSGSLLASGADNPAGEMAARIWDVKVGICLHVLEGHTTKFAGLIFLPSDKRIITGSCSRAVHMWDLMTGACVHSFEVPQDIDTVVDAIACSSDGDLLATSYEDHSLRLWKVETSECLHVLTGLTGFNLGLAFSPGGAQFTLTSNDGIKTWEAATGAELWTSEKAVCTVGSAVYSPDGQKIACGAVGNAVSLLDPATGETTSALQGHTGEIYNIVYSQDGDQFASASRDGSVRLWSPSGDSRVVFTDNSKPALFSLFIGFSPSGHQLAGSSWDERIKLTDTGVLKQDRLLNMQPRLSHQFPAHVHLIPGGRYIASHGQDGVRIWDRDSGKLIHRLTNCQGDCEQVFISPNGLQLVTTGPRETADLWDVEKGAFLLTFDLGPYDSSRRTLVFSENNRLAATDQADVRVWNQRTFNLEQQLNGHDQRVTKIVFSPGRGDQLATSGADLTIRLWELSTGHCSLTLQGPQQEVTNIAYSPNGTRLFTSFEDGTVQVWNVCDGENLGLVNTGCSHGSSMFSPRGRFFVVYHGCDSASVEGTIVIWDMIENRLLWTLGKTVGQTMLAFSSDDRFLVSSCHDVVIRLWDLETGEEIAKTESSRGVNHSLALDLSTADRVGAGLLLIVGSKEGDVSVWALKERHDSATVTSAMDSHNSNSDSGRRGQTAAGGSLEGGDERRTYGFHLQWTTAYGVLNAEGARIEGTQGLGGTNSRVLMQNGALGEPVAPPGLGHIIKKVMTTRNVMSRLKSHQKPQVIEE
ncbi:hypothetical protein BGZ83_005547 [Gryganskiella cystojenkinii]|nr:hypothetical protein BGZ83_005547 [Gryganskiella cystojenkinii]